MARFKTLKVSTRILLLGIGSVFLTVLALTASIAWQSSQFNALVQTQIGKFNTSAQAQVDALVQFQSGQFNALAQVQVDKLIDADLTHIVEGVYNLIKVQDEAVQTQVNTNAVRQAILGTRVGKAGYVFVIGSQGDDQGRYIVSEKGQRDGENIWNVQDANGNYIIQAIVNTALKLGPGETARVRYMWQNLGDTAPRWQIAQVAYYEPWHWVIVATAMEDDFNDYRLALQAGQDNLGVALKMGQANLVSDCRLALQAGQADLVNVATVANVASVIVVLLVGLAAGWLARSIKGSSS